MPKVDETGRMLDDSPDSSDDSQRGGKKIGDPGLHDANERGGKSSSADALGDHTPTPGVLPGEKPPVE